MWSSDTGSRKRETQAHVRWARTEKHVGMLYLSPRQDALVPTTACHAEADGRETYACIAVSKGIITRALTRWAVIGQQFRPFC